MKIETIKKEIKNKLDKWTDSIEDENIKMLVKKNTIVTGGCITSMLLGEEVNDYDIYFKNKATTKAVAEYYVAKIETSHGVRVLDGAIDNINNEYENVTGDKTQVTIALNSLDENRIKILISNIGCYNAEIKDNDKETFEIAFVSPNAITLTDKIQIVIRFHGTPKEIHDNYDFVHATNYFDYGKNELVTNKEALESILTKQLKYHGSLYPITSVVRSKKFIKRGWNISASEYLKMCYQISLLDLSDVNVLEEQLMGVDVLYFQEIIRILKDTKEKDANFSLTFSWISTLIDRISN